MQRTLGNAAVGQLLHHGQRVAPPSTPVQRVIVQRLMTAGEFAKRYAPASKSDATLAVITRLLDEFHIERTRVPLFEWGQKAKQSGSDARQQMLTRLNKLNVVIYAWFDEHRSFNIKGVPNSDAMFNLLDNIQDEHRELVAKVAEHAGELPISTAGVSPEDQERASGIWQGLVSNKGNIQIGGDKSFRKEALAAFANLLQSDAGRDLVQSLQQDPTRPEGSELGAKGRSISIAPVKSGGFAASPANLQSNAHLAAKLGERGIGPEDSDKFKQIDRQPNLTEQLRRSPGYSGITVGQGDAARSYRYGAGQGSNVAFPIGSRARSHGIKIDESGRQILSPAFIVLGHELYHAQHYLEGSAFDSAQADSDSDKENQRLLADASRGDAGDYSDYENTEEYVTIAHNENYLREQYGLSPRATHTIQAMYLAGRLDALAKREEPGSGERANIERLQLALQKAGWIENQRSKPDIRPDVADVIVDEEGELGRLLAQLKMTTIEQAIARAAGMLEEFSAKTAVSEKAESPGGPVSASSSKTSEVDVSEKAEPPREPASVSSAKRSASGEERLAAALPGALRDVDGTGMNCLIRAVLVAAGVKNFESLVDGIRKHINRQEPEVEPGAMLDLAQAEGGILLSHLQHHGLLDPGRALHVYLETGKRVVVQDGNNPVNIYLSGRHFQAIV